MEKVFYKSRLVNTVLEVRNTDTFFDKTLKVKEGKTKFEMMRETEGGAWFYDEDNKEV